VFVAAVVELGVAVGSDASNGDGARRQRR